MSPFSFSRYQKKCYKILILTIDDVINFENYLPLSSNIMANREKKRETQKQKNINISTMKRGF